MVVSAQVISQVTSERGGTAAKTNCFPSFTRLNGLLLTPLLRDVTARSAGLRVGLFVGNGVCGLVGRNVGLIVGIGVGELVGLTVCEYVVGSGVGDFVGRNVRLLVGIGVGELVGRPVGEYVVGSGEGSAEGRMVIGFSVGVSNGWLVLVILDGCSVVFGVDRTVGCIVGSIVVGPGFGACVGGPSEGTTVVGCIVGASVGGSVGREIKTAASTPPRIAAKTTRTSAP